MSGVIATIPRLRFTDATGAPLVGGTVTVYAAGTTTQENTWQDRDLTILNENPIQLDGLGSCVVWLDSAKTYKIVVRNKAGASLWTQDNIVGGGVDTSFDLSLTALTAALEAAALSASNAEASRDAVDNRIYPGTYSSAPTTRPDGSAIQPGDRYVDSTGNQEYIYLGGTWNSPSAAHIYPGTYSAAPSVRPNGAAIQNGDRYLNSVDSQEYARIGGAWVNQTVAAAASAFSAAGSASAAATSAGNAATSEGNANAARAGAQTAQAGAEDARAAAVTATVFATYSAGLAAVSDNQYFSVASADGSTRRIYKRVSSKGVLQSIRPFVNIPGGEQKLPLVTSPVIVGVSQTASLVDFDSLYAAAGYNKFRNLANASDPDTNALGFGFRGLLHGSMLASQNGGGSATITGGAADSAGGTEAFNVALTAAASGLVPWAQTVITLPAGQWTMGAEVTGVSGATTYNYRADYNGNAGAWGTLTLDGTWKPLSSTFELTADTALTVVWGASAQTSPSTDMAYKIQNLRFVPGSSAGTPSTLNNDLATLSKTSAKFAGPVLSSATGANTLELQLATKRTFTAMSFVACVNWDDGATGATGILLAGSQYDSPPHNNDFFFGPTRFSTTPANAKLGLNLPSVTIATGTASIYNKGLSTVGFASDATGTSLYLDGIPVHETSSAFGSVAMTVLQFLGNGSINFTGDVSGFKLWDHQRLTDAQMATESAVLLNRALAKGMAFSPITSYAIWEGDSNTAGFGSVSFTTQIGPKFTPYLQGRNFAVSGARLRSADSTNSLQTRLPSILAHVAILIAKGIRPIYLPIISTNDLVPVFTSTAAVDSYYADLLAIYAAVRAAGAKVVGYTQYDANNGHNQTMRAYFNTKMKSDMTKFDAFTDFAGDSGLNTWNATDFTDSLHLSETGKTKVVNMQTTAITPLVI